MTEKCKEKVFSNLHHYPCSRNVWMDGYCKQHHPETIKKRQAEQAKRYEEKMEKDPIVRLSRENKRLRKALEEITSYRQEYEEVYDIAYEALKVEI